MAKGAVVKQVYCKRATFLDQKGRPTLQAKLGEALAKLKKVGQRKETPGDDRRYVRIVFYHRSYAGMLFGILAGYERGTNQLTIAEDDEAELLSVQKVAPPVGRDEARQEFLEGLCYFAISGNHVVMAPARAIGPKHAEYHFNWLLEQAGLLSSTNRVGLSDQIASVTQNRIRESHVKEVSIGAGLLSPAPANDGEQPKQVTKEFGLGVEILKSILGERGLERMRLADAIDGNIEVSVKVRYLRKTTDAGHKVLDNIALALRNVDEDDVTLRLADGGTVKGSELKLFRGLSVSARDGIPDADRLFGKMREWLISLIDNKTIDP